MGGKKTFKTFQSWSAAQEGPITKKRVHEWAARNGLTWRTGPEEWTVLPCFKPTFPLPRHTKTQRPNRILNFGITLFIFVLEHYFNSVIPSTTTTPAPPSGGCFPSVSKVNLENGKIVKLSQLKIGDKVQTGILAKRFHLWLKINIIYFLTMLIS